MIPTVARRPALSIVALVMATGCGASSPAVPPGVALHPGPGDSGSQLLLEPPPAPPPARVAPAPPAIAADGARCRGSEEKTTACVDGCWKADEAACASLVQACEEGEGFACGHAAAYLEAHPHEGAGPARLLRYLDTACSGGMLFGCARMASLYTVGGSGVLPDADLASAAERRTVALLRKQCDENDPHGCMGLGSYAERGRGMDQDEEVSRRAFAKGFKLMNTACRAGDGLMCHLLGVYHLDGTGTPVDRAKAHGFIERACTLTWKSQEASCLMLKQVFGEAGQKAAVP